MFWVIALVVVVAISALGWRAGRRRTATDAQLERQRIQRGIDQATGEEFRGSGF